MLDIQNILKPISTDNQTDVSTANMDLVKKYLPNEPKPVFRTLTFAPKQGCTLIINGKDKVVVTPKYGLNMDERFRYMNSVVIVEAGIDFYFLASY